MDWTGSGPLSFIIRKYPLQMFIYRQSSVKTPIKNFKQNYLSFLHKFPITKWVTKAEQKFLVSPRVK